MSADFDVFCGGFACWDLAFSVDHHPGNDEKMGSRWLRQGAGGPAATAAATVSSLGGASFLATYLGNDWAGEAIAGQAQRKGVPADGLFWAPMQTPLAMVIVKPDGLRTVVNHKGAEPEVDLDSLLEKLQHSRFLLVDPHWPKLAGFLVKKAKKCNIPTMLDAGSVSESSRRLAPLVDYCVCSRKFAADMSGQSQPESMLKSMAPQFKNLIITLGPKGCLWEINGQSGATPACEVEAVDTTGAGDIFHGALALALARKTEITEALAYASKAAAVGCTRLGSMLAVPSKHEL